MSLKEKVSQADLALYELLRNPVLGPEFLYNLDLDPKYDTPFEFTYYQKVILCDFNPFASVTTARATGITVSLYSLLIWALAFNMFPEDYILYTVPSKVHLEPVFSNLVRLFRNNSFLKNFIDRKSGVNNSEYKITLKNGAVLMCRIAGQSGTGANLIGLHTPFIECDEGGYYPHAAFQEMQPSLNTWTPGFREMVSGVPTGMREKNVLYQSDVENINYTKHRVTAFDNPRKSDEQLARDVEQYGGEDTEDYIHYIMGQHGKPVFALFDRGLFRVESYPTYRLNIDGIKEEELGSILAKINSFPSIPKNSYGTVVGIDLGYTEPTAIVILYLDDRERFRFHGRIQLTKVSYTLQKSIIDFIDTKFSPTLIGIDRGGSGVAVVHDLHEGKEYVHKNYDKRLIPIDFSSSTVVGTNSDGSENKVKTKVFTVSVLQEYSNNHRLIYSSTDPDMMTELERMTYTKSTTGEISYRTITDRGGSRGEDHFTSALLCGVGAYHLTTEFAITNQKPTLMQPSWIV